MRLSFLWLLATGTANSADLSSYFSGVSLTKGYKDQTAHNPLFTQHFGADPYAMVYNGRVYVYMTHDSFRYDSNGNLTSNTYSQIQQLYCISSEDMVNWTDHGAMNVAGTSGSAKWAGCSWAPTACHKTVNGKEKFFLYFANNANGIGVISADSPTGPWTDPRGSALITRTTTNCTTIPWVFDPAVLVDDDGTGYLYFGGGAPDGSTGDAKNYPKSARVVKLGSDMASLNGDPVTLNPPYLFEDAGANKIGNKYIYSYCTNWSCSDPGAANIAYMTSDKPMEGFSYTGGMFKNPGAFFSGSTGNNHHSMIKFNDQYYLFYHTLVLQNDMGITGGYRCTHVDKIDVNESTAKISYCTGTRTGATQIKALDPFVKQEAETMAWMGGIDTKSGGSNQLVTSIDKGDWIGISGVDFGTGASTFAARVSSTSTQAIKICLDKADGTVVGYAEVPNTNGSLKDITAKLNTTINGKHDLFFVFSGSFDFDYWQFKTADAKLEASTTDLLLPGSLTLTATTTESNISKMDFYRDSSLIGSSSQAPYELKLEDLTEGYYTFNAVMTDNSGNTTTTNNVKVTVRLPQGPYEGVAQELPGTVEMERYDVGGEGYAYHDEDSTNSGKTFRFDGVDIDGNDTTGYVLGWTKVGEWIEYTVDVKYADTYTWTAKVASGLDGSGFQMYLDDEDISGKIEVENTGSWSDYTTTTGKTTQLSEGTHVLKIQITGAYCNIDYITFNADNSGAHADAFNNEAIAIYPNPASDHLTVTGIDGISQLELMGTDGKSIATTNGNQLSLPRGSKGLYLLKVNTSEGTYYKKIMVK